MTIGNLITTAGTSTVSWRDGKKQIRAALKLANIKPIGFFRQRKDNRGEYSLSVEGGSVRALRRPNAQISIHKCEIISAADLTPAERATILAAF